jgi:hypothetical protein
MTGFGSKFNNYEKNSLENGAYEQQFRAIDKNNEEIFYGSTAPLYVDLEFKNFHWVVVRVWEPA